MPRGLFRTMAVGLTFVAIGCSDDILTDPEFKTTIGSSSQVLRRALGVRQLWPQEATFRFLANSIPGYAGHYLDADGTLVAKVLETDVAQPSAAVVHSLASSLQRRIAGANGRIRFELARFSFSELRQWRDDLFVVAMSHPDVLSLDLDERKNAVRIGVVREPSRDVRATVQSAAKDLGVPLLAVVFEEIEPVAEELPVVGRASLSATLQDHLRPMKAGIQTTFVRNGDEKVCTVGLISRWQFTTPVMVTNTHCSDEWGTLDGGTYYQHFFNHLIGSEIVDQTTWECNPGAECVYADANVVSITDHSPPVHQIARPIPGSGITIDPSSPTYFVVGEHPQSVMGMDVFMVGRSSGLTAGEVDGTCVHYKNPDNHDQILVCQDTGTYVSHGGDSGAPVFTIQETGGTSVLMAGLHWGKVGLVFPGLYERRAFSPMSQIRIDLNMLEPLFHW